MPRKGFMIVFDLDGCLANCEHRWHFAHIMKRKRRKMFEIDKEKVIEELEKDDWANGDLCLGIYCTKCNAQFELNRDACALAVLMDTPFLEYLKAVQNSKCDVCNGTGCKKDE